MLFRSRCPGDTWDVAADLHSSDDADRYAAVKAAGILHDDRLSPALAAIAADDREDWRVRLEALGSLARVQPERWVPELGAVARDLHRPVPEQMEAVLILSETRRRRRPTSWRTWRQLSPVGPLGGGVGGWAPGRTASAIG